MVYNVEFYPEICCDLCGDIIHNHFDCPVCKKGYEPTNIYFNLYEWFEKGEEKMIVCEHCNTKFKVLDEDPDWYYEVNIEVYE